jgi:hypothetical protein
VSYVQGKTHANGFTNSTTVAATLDAAVGVGHGLCVAVGWAGNDDTLSVSDDKGNVYSFEGIVYNSNQGYSLGLAYCRNITNAPQTITATLPAARLFATIIVDEYSDLGAFDGAALNGQQGPGTATDAVTSTAITTTADGDLVWGVGINIESHGMAFGTGFTGRQSLGGGAANTFYTEDRIQASAGSIAATFTTSNGGDNFVTGVLAFMPAIAASLDESVGNIAISAAGAVRVSASAAKTLAPITASATGAVRVSASLAETLDAIGITAAGTVTAAQVDDLLTKALAAKGLGGTSPRRRRRLFAGVELRLPGLWAAVAGEAGLPPEGEAAFRCDFPLLLRAAGDVGARGRTRLRVPLGLVLAGDGEAAPYGEGFLELGKVRGWAFATGRHDHFTDSDILLLTRFLIG